MCDFLHFLFLLLIGCLTIYSLIFFQLFREVRIMKTLNHPNIGEFQHSELSCVCPSPCCPLCWHVFLCVLQCSCLRWLRQRRHSTWSWSTPVEVSGVSTTLIGTVSKSIGDYGSNYILYFDLTTQFIRSTVKSNSLVCVFRSETSCLSYSPVFLYAFFSSCALYIFQLSLYSSLSSSPLIRLRCSLPLYVE